MWLRLAQHVSEVADGDIDSVAFDDQYLFPDVVDEPRLSSYSCADAWHMSQPASHKRPTKSAYDLNTDRILLYI